MRIHSPLHGLHRLLAAATFTAACALALPAGAATELVTNGGFEEGSLAGWSGSVLDNPFSGVDCPGAGAAAEGSCQAFLGSFGGGSSRLSQDLATTAGQAYAVSFSFASDGSAPAHFSVAFGGQTLYGATSPAAGAAQAFVFTATALAPSTALVFSFDNAPGYYGLDAVSVTAVPEPASAVLMGLGALGLAAWRRRGGRPGA